MPEKKTVQNLEMDEKLRDVFLAGCWVGSYLNPFQRIIPFKSGFSWVSYGLGSLATEEPWWQYYQSDLAGVLYLDRRHDERPDMVAHTRPGDMHL